MRIHLLSLYRRYVYRLAFQFHMAFCCGKCRRVMPDRISSDNISPDNISKLISFKQVNFSQVSFNLIPQNV